MMNMRSKLATSLAFVVLSWAGVAHAAPKLQLYIEGADYDNTSQSWVLSKYSQSANGPLRLWAIGDTSKGSIVDVKLAINYAKEIGPLTFEIKGGKTDGYGGFIDSSIAGDPTFSQYVEDVADGGVPKLYGGKDLPSHDEYVDGVSWQEFFLGDFNQTDSPIADFSINFPTPESTLGQINVYEITVLNSSGDLYSGGEIRFDLYDHVQSRSKGIFAPFSHDGAVDVHLSPTPNAAAGMGVLMAGLGGVGLLRRKHRQLPQ